ncbi:MAG: hypothetical protein HY791_28840 [Deltaproteobacteria bacterium]|nr:hypothetical protein [Deltaproteobacteria bacterium]
MKPKKTNRPIRLRLLQGAPLAFATLLSCEPMTKPPETGVPDANKDQAQVDRAPGAEKEQKLALPETAPAASPRVSSGAPHEDLLKNVPTWFAGHQTRRIHLQLDKPLYQPGETIWVKSWDLTTKALSGSPNPSVRLELINPKGAVISQKHTQQQNGQATNDFELPAGVEGGEYKLRATAQDGVVGERPFIVNAYEAPRIKKKLEFLKKAYGPGDEISATVKINRPTGEPLGKHPIRGVVVLDGENLPPVTVQTNPEGGAVVKVQLPSRIERGDGLLTVLIEDGGVTESVSKRVPIVLKKVQLSVFPEGGELVTGLPSRVYIEAKNTIGKPADVEGRILDDHGSAVAKFATYHAGLGRFEFTPNTGRTYQVEITRPVGITEKIPLPVPREEGCVLKTFDDFDSQEDAIRASVRCTSGRRVVVAGLLRESMIDAATVDVPEGGEAVVYLASTDPAIKKGQGAARVTLFDDKLTPLAERVVFRNRRRGLKIEVASDSATYSPREQVALTVRTTDGSGAPVAADVALSVVDDTVLSFADDKTGHMLSKLLLEPEVPGEVEEPNFFFDVTEEKSAMAMDFLLGTRGWRKFEWTEVNRPPMPDPTATGLPSAPQAAAPAEPEPMPEALAGAVEEDGRAGGKGGGVRQQPARGRPAMARPAVPASPPPAPPMGAVAPPMPAKKPVARAPMADNKPADNKLAKDMPAQGPMGAEHRAKEVVAEKKKAKAEAFEGDKEMEEIKPVFLRPNAIIDDDRVAGEAKADRGAMRRLDLAEEPMMRDEAQALAPVRVFPAPKYDGAFSGTRTDFRETIHWEPSVKTGAAGKAVVTFYLSDAVTSFRVVAEGAGGGLLGRGDKVLKSSLPFSLSVKLPLEVSQNDKLLLPLTLTNEKAMELPVNLTADFGQLLKLEKSVQLSKPNLAANARESVFYPVDVVGTKGRTQVEFAADAGGLSDRFTREVVVEPLGFPVSDSRSGTLKDRIVISADLGAALPGTAEAKLTLYPSPVATLLSGVEGMVREPYGCFEQTSSSNYPNVMVLNYLRSTDSADPDLVERVGGVLDRGYKKLVSFESQAKGYEWFGRSPAHEALTAYGVLEFVDMKNVYDVDDGMLERTIKYLKSQRDGQGGYRRDPNALDSFGRAAPEITNAYITYSMTEAGMTDLGVEISAAEKTAMSTNDPYLLSLTASTLLNIPNMKDKGRTAAKRLASMQDSTGAWKGKTHSITYSTGMNLDIETTALAVLTLLEAGGFESELRGGVDWLVKNRGGYGNFGSTQATVLALKALTEYSKASRKTQTSGSIALAVNGQVVTEQAYTAGRKEPIVLEGFGKSLRPGQNELVLTHTGGGELPYSMALDYTTAKPASHPDTVVDLNVSIAKTELKMGDAVRVTAKLKNKTSQGQPLTMVRVGLPGGLTSQTKQLKDLVDNKVVAFFETRPREVILYLSQMAPSEEKEIPLDLTAVVPGTYTGPASRAYLYYTDDRKVWVDPLKVSIAP